MRLVATLTAALLAACAAADQVVGPRLEVVQELDFGSIWHGEPCELSIDLKNVGDAPLEIVEVRSSCGCTTGTPEKMRLEAGESTPLRVTYDTKRGVRSVTQNLTIITNDPGQRERVVAIRGEVKNVYDGLPANNLVLGMVPFDADIERSLELVSNMDESVILRLGPTPAGAPFDARLEPIEQGRRYRLVIRTRPPMKVGPVSEKIEIATTNLRFPTLTVPVNGRVMEHVGIVPPDITVVPRATRPTRRVLMLNHLPGRRMNVTRVESSHPSVTTSIGPKAAAPPNSEFVQQHIYVQVPAYSDVPSEGVLVTVYTDDADPKYQEFRVRVQRMTPGRRAAENDE